VHRNFIVFGPADALRSVARELEPVAEIVSIALDDRGALKPPGGVLTIQALNRSADEVLRRLDPLAQRGDVIILFGAANAIVDVERQEMIDKDADTMLWEEMQQNLRNEGRISVNSLALMALGGAIAAAALVAMPLLHLLGLLASSIISPGFAPIAGISLGIAMGRLSVVRRAALAALAGYAVTVLAAALTFLLLRALNPGVTAKLLSSSTSALVAINAPTLLISAAAAVAGALMIVSLRDIYVVGSLIALALVPAAALLGCAAAAGEWHVVVRSLAVIGVDAGLIVAGSLLVFWLEQRFFHRRRAMA